MQIALRSPAKPLSSIQCTVFVSREKILHTDRKKFKTFTGQSLPLLAGRIPMNGHGVQVRQVGRRLGRFLEKRHFNWWSFSPAVSTRTYLLPPSLPSFPLINPQDMETAAPVYREEVEEGLLNGRESQVGQETAARGEKEGRPGIREDRASSSSHRHYLSNRTAFSITTYSRAPVGIVHAEQ